MKIVTDVAIVLAAVALAVGATLAGLAAAY